MSVTRTVSDSSVPLPSGTIQPQTIYTIPHTDSHIAQPRRMPIPSFYVPELPMAGTGWGSREGMLNPTIGSRARQAHNHNGQLLHIHPSTVNFGKGGKGGHRGGTNKAMPPPPAPIADTRAHIRPHPYLTANILYLSHVPPDMPYDVILNALPDCPPTETKWTQAVLPGQRLQPDQYYEWIPRSGILEFGSLYHAEKALAILVAHPSVAHTGLHVSPYPPRASPFHQLDTLPFPDPPVPARYIYPYEHVAPLQHATDDMARALQAQVPSAGELFDAIRSWGSIRQLSVWLVHDMGVMRWGARVEFWYGYEASRFDVGFGNTASLVKGWKIKITSDLFPPLMDSPMTITPTDHSAFVPPASSEMIKLPLINLDPEILRQSGYPIFPVVQAPTVFSPTHLPPVVLHPNAPSTQPPWVNHNIFAGQRSTRPPPSGPLWIPHYQAGRGSGTWPHARRGSPRASLSEVKPRTRQRTWSEAATSSAEGSLIITGLVADDGMYIPHGPGQHIRPAPKTGPGSSSVSGLVDYANVFVKNLDPDINSYWLEHLFSNVGQIVSAKVMRDNLGRSRGYGFVSFTTPAEAAEAIEMLNDTLVGTQYIQVAHHQPTKLRPEKQAERLGRASISMDDNVFGRRSISPNIFARGGRRLSAPPPPPSPPLGVTDNIRALSPPSRALALRNRVVPRVKRYARDHRVPEGYIEPTVSALVAQDLTLIPVLHSAVQLEHKITETISVLQEDPELNINIGVAPAGDVPPLRRGSVPLTDADVRKRLRDQVERIDPLNADPVAEIMWANLSPADRIVALSNRGYLAAKYNVAKKEHNRQQKVSTLSEVEEQMEQGEKTETSSPIPGSVQSSPDVPLALRLPIQKETTLDALSARPAVEIMAQLSSPSGDKLLEQLGMSRPNPAAAIRLGQWIAITNEKPASTRRAAIVAELAKRVDGLKEKRSVRVKVARAMVSKEDLEAVCKLMAYPTLLNAKARLAAEAMQLVVGPKAV